jgi:hypothetical protein
MTALQRRSRTLGDSILTRIGEAVRGLAKVAPTVTLGTSMTGPNDWGGTFSAPDRKLNLIGQRRYDEFEEMVRDVSIVAAGVRLFLNLIANAVWTVNPPEGLNANEEAVAQGYADFLYNEIYGMSSSWSTVVRKAAGFRLQGFAILEWTARRTEDGQIGLLDIEHRPQRTIIKWVRDPSGTVEAVVQRVNGRNEVPLPRSKIVYAVDDVLTDDPEGVGLYRHLYATADRLKTFLDLEEVGFATDLRGIPIARAPLGELQAEVLAAGPPESEARQKLETARVSKLRPLWDFVQKHIRNKNSGLLLASDTYSGKTVDGGTAPSNVPKWSLELLNGDSSSFESMANAVNRMNQELARILGTEHLLLGADGGGSLALARSKVGTFYLTVTSTLLDLVEVFDRDIVTPIAELNGWPEELRPQFGVNEISDRDIEQVASVLLKLSQAGATMMPDDPAVGEIYDLLGLTRPPEQDPELDSSLRTDRKDVKADPELERNPEDGIAKVRVLRSRRHRLRKRSR